MEDVTLIFPDEMPHFLFGLRFILMNSFSTSADTMDYLKKYPEIVKDKQLEMLQNKVPKLDATTFKV